MRDCQCYFCSCLSVLTLPPHLQGYEWGIVAICVLLYIAITEVYKFIRRKMNPDKIAKRQTDEEKDLARFDTQAEDVFPNAEKILKKNKEKAK